MARRAFTISLLMLYEQAKYGEINIRFIKGTNVGLSFPVCSREWSVSASGCIVDGAGAEGVYAYTYE